MIKTNVFDATRRAMNGVARATVREIDDDNLMQQIKSADVHHSETTTNFERFQPVGFTAVPMKQSDDQSQQGGGGGDAGQNKSELNNNQPKGEAAEAVVLYIGGNREHPVAIGIDDRRVRPYGMKAGEGAHYSPDGSGQMVLHKADGLYVLTLDDQQQSGAGGSGGSQQAKTRFLSLRHVNKGKQSRKIPKKQPGQQQQQQQQFKHEGDSVNVEVRLTKGRIEFRAGDGLVGYYDVAAKKWSLYSGSEQNSLVCDQNHTHIRHGSNAIFVDSGGCWSTTEIQIKADSD